MDNGLVSCADSDEEYLGRIVAADNHARQYCGIVFKKKLDDTYSI